MSEIDDLIPLCISDDVHTRVDAYNALTLKMTSQQLSGTWGEHITSDMAKKIIANLKKDLYDQDSQVCAEAASFLGYYLDNEKLMDLLSDSDEQNLFNDLIILIESTKEKRILTTALWSLSQSKFCCDIYIKNLDKILKLVTSLISSEQAAVTTNEALQVIKSLMECIPEEMKKKISFWFASVFVNLFHEMAKIRSCAFACLSIYKGTNPSNNLLKLNQLIVPFVPQIKSHCKAMNNLIQDDHVLTFKIWRLLVTMLGKNLHTGTALINGLLEVVEKGFKHSLTDYRIEAFKCWQVLISNFSLEPAVLNHPKRLKLLVAPFKSNNAKTEEVALTKLSSWWFLASNLGEKSPDNFELVVVPLLKFCFNPTVNQKGNKERVSLGMSSPGRKFSSLYIKSLEVLARLLSPKDTILDDSFNFSTSNLNHDIVTPFIFNKNSQLFFNAVADALSSIDRNNSKQYKLGVVIMKALLLKMNSYLEANQNKKEAVDMVKEFFQCLTELENRSTPGDALSLFLFEFLELQINHEFGFAKSIINSRHYNILTGSKAQDIMNGTLSNYFIHKLSRPCLLYFASNKDTEERYYKTWTTITAMSKPATGRLFSYQSTIEELSDISQTPSCKPAVLFQLWNIVCGQLDNFIKENNLIDQGNGSETDWSCIYETLLFPVVHARDHLEVLDDDIYHIMVATWSSLWLKFVSLTPLSVAYDPGCECDYIAKHLFTIINKEITLPPDVVPKCFMLVSDILFCLVDKFKFSELGKKPPRLVQSPAKVRKKPHLLSNLGNCVELLNHLVIKAMQMLSAKRHHIVSKLCLAAKRIFESVTNEKMTWPLVSSLLESLQVTIQINPSAKFNADAEKKLIGMWKAFCHHLESHIATKVTHEQLTRLSPLFITALQSSHQGIKKQMESLWVSKFSSTTHSLPSSLMDALKDSHLPPASISDTPLDSSQIIQIDICKTNSPLFKDMKSLKSPKFSFGKDSAFKSPLRLAPTQRKSLPNKQNLEDMDEDAFVKVSTPKSKRVLTPRQKEKLKERSEDIPAMYNDLSQSTSQFSQLVGDDSILRSNSVDSLGSNNLSFTGKININTTSSSVSPSNSAKDSSMATNSRQSHESTFCDSIGEKEPINASDKPSKSDDSLSDSITSLHGEDAIEIISESGKESRKSSSDHKRKAATPHKKCIEDVRKILKGNSNKRNQNESPSPKEVPHKKKQTPSKSSLAPQLQNSSSPKTKKASSAPKTESSKLVKQNSIASISSSSSHSQSDSEDEIPSTQTEEVSLTPTVIGLSKFSPHHDKNMSSSPSRPFRNKRKKNSEDYEYIMPNKRSKLASDDTNDSSHSSDAHQTIVLESDTDDSEIMEDLKSSPSKNNKKKDLSSKESPPTSTIFPQASVTTPKTSRSGRKIIPPNKDMPQPMTPPSHCKRQSSQDSVEQLSSPSKSAVSPAKVTASNKVSNAGSPSPKKQKVQSSQQNVVDECNNSLEGDEMNYSSIELMKDDSYQNSEKISVIDNSATHSPSKSEAESRQKLTNNDATTTNLKSAKSDENDLELNSFAPVCSKICESGSNDSSHVNSNTDINSSLDKVKQKEPRTLRSKDRLSPKVLRSTLNKNKILKRRELPSKKVKKALKMCKKIINKNVKTKSSEPVKLHAVIDDKINQNVLDDKFSNKENKMEASFVKEDDENSSKVSEASLPLKLKPFESTDNSESLSEPQIQPESSLEKPILAESNSLTKENLPSQNINVSVPEESSSPSKTLNLKELEKKIGSPIHILKSPNNKLTLIKIQVAPAKDLPSSKEDISNKKSLDSTNLPNKVSSLGGKIEASKLEISDQKEKSEFLSSKNRESRLSPQQGNIIKGQKEQTSMMKFLVVKGSTNVSALHSPTKMKTPQSSKISSPSEKITSATKSSENVKKISLAHNVTFTPPVSTSLHSPISASKIPRKELPKRLFSKLSHSGQSEHSISKSLSEDKLENLDSMLKGENMSKHSLENVESNSVLDGMKFITEKCDLSPSSPVKITKDGLGDHTSTKESSSPLSKHILSKNHKDAQPSTSKEVNKAIESSDGTHEAISGVASIIVSESPRISPSKNSVESASEERGEFVSNSTDNADKSPDKSPSKLSSTLGTPERKKLSLMKVQVPASRAAIMLACAKKAMKTRGGTENIDSLPTDSLKASLPIPSAKGILNAESPSLKRKHIDLIADDRPWVKHKPSPDASPASSILKKRMCDDEALVTFDDVIDTCDSPSTSASKNRRVSFADPPVSESVEIPRSASKTSRKRAQKRLDMTEAQVKEAAPLTNEFNIGPLNCFMPIYSPLVECHEPIDHIASELTSPSLVDGLVALFKERGCQTIGSLCKMTEAELHSFPVRSPKTSKTLQSLERYSQKIQKSPDKPEEKQTRQDDASVQENSEMEGVSLNYGLDSDPKITDQIQELCNKLNKEPVQENIIKKDAFVSANMDLKEQLASEMDQDSSTIDDFVGKLSSPVKYKLFKGLTKVISYDKIVDIFYEFLKNKKS